MRRSSKTANPKTASIEGGRSEQPLRFLAYGLPRARNDHGEKVLNCNGFTLHDVPLGSNASFLDYDGAVVFAGAFETTEQSSYGGPTMISISPADLDLREKEFLSAFQHGKTFIFLMRHLPMVAGYHEVPEHVDLFRRICAKFGIPWHCRQQASPMVESLVPEFRDYVTRFGTGYVEFMLDKAPENFLKKLCTWSDRHFGFVVGERVFFLPSPVVERQEQLQQVVCSAIEAAIAYRNRLSREMPAWTDEFSFCREAELRAKLQDAQKTAMKLEGEISSYTEFKGALCFQSNPLVEVVQRILHHFFGILLKIDDKCIEDATLCDQNDAVLVVVEIKGVKGNFTRTNVNQVDGHRERLGLKPTTPGVLIMNTMMGADSMKEKDERPHPDIIKKAVAENVLLVRTLDLLRFADGVEKGVLQGADLRNVFLTQAGWLRVEGDCIQVVKG